MGALLFTQLSGIQMLHVVFKGSQPMLVDIMGGHVMMGFDSLQATLPHIRSGRLRALAIGSEKRTPLAPEIPTVPESGGPAGFLLGSWYGFFAPAGVPQEVITRMHGKSAKALTSAELRERFSGMGVSAIADTPDQFAATIKNDIVRWARVVKASNLKFE